MQEKYTIETMRMKYTYEYTSDFLKTNWPFPRRRSIPDLYLTLARQFWEIFHFVGSRETDAYALSCDRV